MTKHQIFIGIVCAFIMGIACEQWMHLSFFLLYIGVLGSIVVFCLCLKKSKGIRNIAIFSFFFFLGALRVYAVIGSITSHHPSHITYYDGQKVQIIGIIDREIKTTLERQEFVVNVSHVNDALVSGNVLIKERGKAYSYGDQLRIDCTIHEPMTYEDFDYKAYLRYKHIDMLCLNAHIEIMDQRKGNAIYAYLLSMEQSMEDILRVSLPFDAFALANGLLFGDMAYIPKDVNSRIQVVGLSHVLAISGAHFTFLTIFLLYIFIYIGLSKKQSMLLISFLLFIYLVWTAFPASAIRSYIMSLGVAIAFLLGRKSDVLGGLLLSAFVILLLDPYFLFDIGFQLSFLAVLGIYYFYQPCLWICQKIHMPNWIGIRDALAVTLAVFIVVTPISVYYFHQISFLTFIANILVLPISSLLMITLIFGLICSFFFPFLSHIFFYGGYVLFEYMLWVVRTVSLYDVFVLYDIRPSFFFTVFLYVCIVMFGIWIRKRWEKPIY